MRVGVIGCGSIGSRHAKNLVAMGHEVFAFDPREHNSDDPWTWCADVYTLIDCQPRAVLICTPASGHATQAKELLDLGYVGPLFVEKPLALSVEECAVFRTWPHPTTMVGYMLRFHPKLLAMRDLIKSPISGGFYCDCDWREWPGTNYAPMLLECSHELDAAMFCGAPSLVSACTFREHAGEIWLGDDQRWLFSFDAQSESRVRHWMLANGSDDTAIRFRGDEPLGDEMYVDELKHFLSCVEQQIPTITPFADGIRVVDVCETALKMAKASA